MYFYRLLATVTTLFLPEAVHSLTIPPDSRTITSESLLAAKDPLTPSGSTLRSDLDPLLLPSLKNQSTPKPYPLHPISTATAFPNSAATIPNNFTFYDNVKRGTILVKDGYPDAQLYKVIAVPLDPGSTDPIKIRKIYLIFWIPSIPGWGRAQTDSRAWGLWDTDLRPCHPPSGRYGRFDWVRDVTMDIVEARRLVLAAGFPSPWVIANIGKLADEQAPRAQTFYVFQELYPPPFGVLVRQSDRAVIPTTNGQMGVKQVE
ncbi:MAG: hypothetical protein Q9217_001226 [Psora testacea]